jgi:mannan endo-1,4-beta-mannosidase
MMHTRNPKSFFLKTISRNYCLLAWLFIMLLFPSSLRAGSSPQCGTNPLFFGVDLDGYPITTDRLKSVTDEIEVSPHVVVFFLQWPPMEDQKSGPFPEESLDAIWNSGAIPCLTWEPMVYSDGREVMVPWRAIVDGAYDGYLKGFAKEAASWNRPFMIRFAHEMNIARYHWGTQPSGYGPESPYIYRRTFRYVASLFQKAGVQNVLWVFCPNAESVPDGSYDSAASWNRMEAYYPGDAYVDILGMDGYNWGTTQTKAINGWDSQWREFAAMFRPAYEKLRRLAPDKPIFVFETATVDKGGDKGLWIKNAFETAREWKLNGLVWFQVNKEYDWRINSRGGILSGDLQGTTDCHPHSWIRGLIK